MEQAFIEMWTQRMEQLSMGPVGAFGIHSLDFFTDKNEQVPAYAETQMRLIQSVGRGLTLKLQMAVLSSRAMHVAWLLLWALPLL